MEEDKPNDSEEETNAVNDEQFGYAFTLSKAEKKEYKKSRQKQLRMAAKSASHKPIPHLI